MSFARRWPTWTPRKEHGDFPRFELEGEIFGWASPNRARQHEAQPHSPIPTGRVGEEFESIELLDLSLLDFSSLGVEDLRGCY